MTNPLSASTQFSIEGLICEVLLGDSPDPSEVEVAVWFGFPRTPLGCVSDEARDGFPFSKCRTLIREAIAEKRFHLIEHLAYFIHTSLKKQLPIQWEIAIQVHKVDQEGRLSFIYSPKQSEAEKPKQRSSWDLDS